MYALRWLVTTIVACVTLAPLAAHAQQQEAARDSLEQVVRALTARLDSLEQVLERLVSEGEDTAQVADEIAELRAAARAVVPEQPPETTPEPHVIRSRSLNRLNPEISVTGDARLNARRPGPQTNAVDLREFSFGFESALDPYSKREGLRRFRRRRSRCRRGLCLLDRCTRRIAARRRALPSAGG